MRKKIKTIGGVGVFFVFVWTIGIVNFSKIITFFSLPQIGYEKINNTIGTKIYLKDKDGKKINGLFVSNDSDKIIYFFHGNGGSLNRFESYIKYLHGLGYNVLSFDFPGYGESEGFPTEQKLYESSQLFYDYIINDKGFKPENMVLLGYSIGSVLAVDTALKNDANSLILWAGFTDSYEMAKAMFGFNINRLFFAPKAYNNKDKIKNIKIPTMIFHGNEDTLTPYYMGQELYKNSISPNKYFITLNGGTHNNLLYLFGDKIGENMKYFIEQNYEKINL